VPELKLKSIPSPSNLPPEVQAFAFPVKEAIDLLLGRVGDGKDAAITRRNAGQELGGTTIINAGSAAGGGYVPDLTAPPAPTGLVATPGFSVINLEWDDTPYTVGHGHAYTVVYRSSDAMRGNAVQIGMTPGTIYVDAAGSSAGPFYYWVRYVTHDGVMGPWNAVSGVEASTATDPSYLLDLLAGSIDESSLKTESIGGKDAFVFSTKTFAIKYGGTGYVPFIVQTTPAVINGQTIPAGVYLDTAFMRRFVAQAGQIGALAVDDAAIANVSAAKLTIGDGTVGGRLKSAYFASGVAGWQVHPDGTAEFNNVLVRGTVYAESGYFKGTLMGGAVTSIGSGTGLWAGYDGGLYKFRLGVPGSSRMEWNGSAFTIYGSGGQVLMSSGSGIPWSQIESRPTSLSALDASASTKLNGIQAGATVGADASNLNVGMGANLLSNTEFGGGIVAPVVLGWNPGGCTFTPLRGDDTWRPASAQSLEITQGARNGNQWNIGADIYLNGPYGTRQNGIPVVPGKRYEMSGKLASHRTDSGLWIFFFDVNNNYIGEAGTGWVTRKSGGRDLAAWEHAAVFATAPANAVYATAVWRKTDTDVAPASDSYAWLSQPYFGEATAVQTVPSTYTPGVGRGALANVNAISTDNQDTYIKSLQIGNGSTSNIVINTAQLYLDWWGNASFAGTLNAAGGTFRGSLSAATGTFSGSLTAGAVNAVDTINIAGDAIVLASAAQGGTDASVYINVPNSAAGRPLMVWFSGKPLSYMPPEVILMLDGAEVARSKGASLVTDAGNIAIDASGFALLYPSAGAHTLSVSATSSLSGRTATGVKVASLLGKR